MSRIRDIRKQNGVTMKELGKAVGVGESTISMYENGKRQPDNTMLMKIADYFSVSVDYLLGRDEQQKKPTVEDDGLSDRQRAFMESVRSMSPEDLDLLESLMAVVKKQNGGDA